MNSRNSGDHELPTSTRVSARSRYSAPPAAAFTGSSTSESPFDWGSNGNNRAASSTTSSGRKSKGGINGRAYEDDDDDELQGLSSRSMLRNAAKRSNSNSGSVSSVGSNGGSGAADRLNGSQRSIGGSSVGSASKDRPWRTASSSSTATSSYATAKDYETSKSNGSAIDMTRNRSNDSASSTKSLEVTTPTRNRWAQYETDDLEEESRRATSNAVVDMATRMANEMPASPAAVSLSPGKSDGDEEEDDEPVIERQPIMGGPVGSGYGDNYHDDLNEGLEVLESKAGRDALPPRMPGDNKAHSDIGTGSSRSSTDYVKSRLSSLMKQRSSKNDFERSTSDYERGLSSSSPTKQSDHDKVRNEALKMLQIADSCLQDSPRNLSAPSSPRNSIGGGGTAGLFRTSTGGLAMRELHFDEVNQISFKRERGDVASISGIGKFNERNPRSKFDGTFTIGSHDEDDLKKHNSANSNGDPISPNDETPSTWSSRYSVERQLMAITGGLDSTRMLAKMDMLHSSREKTKSARGLYRASGYAMDGSHEEYNDYTKDSSMGFGPMGIWLWLKGTLWSDDLELNYDGTTQSLVRREKAMQKRRRLRWGLAFLMGLSIAVGVLVHLGNPKGVVTAGMGSGSEVNFYVLADEPYDFSNVEMLTRELEALPADAEFIVHLGNANGDIQSRCQEYGFERAAAVLKESPVPVLVIPGDLDWAACGSKEAAEEALNWWDINLGHLEKNWDHPLDIEYFDDVIGNFAFLHKNVLFISVSIVDAETEPSEVTSRLEQNVLWTKRKLSQFEDEEYHAMVIFGHAPPSSKQGEYFWPIMEDIKDLNKPVLYLHANSNGSFEQYTPFNEAENFKAVQLEKRGREAPMKVVVGGGEDSGMDDAFVFERREPTMERVEE